MSPTMKGCLLLAAIFIGLPTAFLLLVALSILNPPPRPPSLAAPTATTAPK